MDDSTKAFFATSLIFAIFLFLLLGLGNALTPLVIAFALSYLFFPLIVGLEKIGIPRHVAVTFIFVFLLAAACGAMAWIVPGLFADANDFLSELPDNALLAIKTLESITHQIGMDIELSRDTLLTFLNQHVSTITTHGLDAIASVFKGVFSNLMGVLLTLLNIVLIPLFFFYVIDDYEQIVENARSFVPHAMRPKMSMYVLKVNQVLKGYIRGQLMVALLLGTLYAIGFTLIGLKFGLLIGLATGVMSIIPYVGSIVGFIAAMVIALANFVGFDLVLGVVLVFIVVQSLEGFVITPKLVGSQVGLSTFTTMLALIIGGNLLGLVGIFLAIPMAAILLHILDDLKDESNVIEVANK